MDLNFDDLIDILDGEEFDERPVDLRTFVTSPDYLDCHRFQIISIR